MTYLDLVRNALAEYEGSTNYLYLDNRRVGGIPSPLVTIGIGCALGRSEALTLPFVLQGYKATPEMIGSDYDRVSDAPFGRVASFYQSFTDIRLPEAAIADLQTKRFRAFVTGLQTIFPDFDTYPETAKAAILELAYGVGIGGLVSYPLFRAAVARKDWKTAAAECASNAKDPAYAKRNANRRSWLLAAAQ